MPDSSPSKPSRRFSLRSTVGKAFARPTIPDKQKTASATTNQLSSSKRRVTADLDDIKGFTLSLDNQKTVVGRKSLVRTSPTKPHSTSTLTRSHTITGNKLHVSANVDSDMKQIETQAGSSLVGSSLPKYRPRRTSVQLTHTSLLHRKRGASINESTAIYSEHIFDVNHQSCPLVERRQHSGAPPPERPVLKSLPTAHNSQGMSPSKRLLLNKGHEAKKLQRSPGLDSVGSMSSPSSSSSPSRLNRLSRHIGTQLPRSATLTSRRRTTQHK